MQYCILSPGQTSDGHAIVQGNAVWDGSRMILYDQSGTVAAAFPITDIAGIEHFPDSPGQVAIVTKPCTYLVNFLSRPERIASAGEMAQKRTEAEVTAYSAARQRLGSNGSPRTLALFDSILSSMQERYQRYAFLYSTDLPNWEVLFRRYGVHDVGGERQKARASAVKNHLKLAGLDVGGNGQPVHRWLNVRFLVIVFMYFIVSLAISIAILYVH